MTRHDDRMNDDDYYTMSANPNEDDYHVNNHDNNDFKLTSQNYPLLYEYALMVDPRFPHDNNASHRMSNQHESSFGAIASGLTMFVADLIYSENARRRNEKARRIAGLNPRILSIMNRFNYVIDMAAYNNDSVPSESACIRLLKAAGEYNQAYASIIARIQDYIMNHSCSKWKLAQIMETVLMVMSDYSNEINNVNMLSMLIS